MPSLQQTSTAACWRRRCLNAWLACAAGALQAACGGGAAPATVEAAVPVAPAPPVVSVVAPTVVTPPQALTVNQGQAANFTVGATGDAPLAYQWLRDGLAISGANTSNFTLAAASAADSGARFAVTVSNAAGSLTSATAVLTVLPASSGGGGVGTATRYAEAWSSADALGNGLQLGVVDPDVPDTLLPVDVLPVEVALANAELSLGTVGAQGKLLRIHGGTLDAATGQVRDHGVNHLVYIKSGAIYKLSLAKGSGVPAPVRLSTESAAGLLQLCGQNHPGTEALVCVSPASGFSGMRYVRLSMSAGDAPLAAPGYTGANGATLAAAFSAVINSPVTGEITGYLWAGSTAFRTDADFGNRADVLTDGGASVSFGISTLGLGEGRMAGGLFFYAHGTLGRYDDTRRSVRTVVSGLTAAPSATMADTTHLYALVSTAAGRQLLKIPDTADTSATVLLEGRALAAASTFKMLDDHLVLQASSASSDLTTVRKRDGATAKLALQPGALLATWDTLGRARYSGNRVFYQRTDLVAGNRFGSVLADGSDRIEHAGVLDVVSMLADSLPAHAVGIDGLQGRPTARVLARTAAGLVWVDRASGTLGPVIGVAPPQQYFGAPYALMTPLVGSNAGVAGHAAYKTLDDGRRVQALDAYFIGHEAGSLHRLSRNTD